MPSEPIRHLPVRPNLVQLRRQAKDLLAAVRSGDDTALAEFAASHPSARPPFKLADAQFALARSYGVSSWPRLVKACELTDAIWRDDAETVKQIVLSDLSLLTENASARQQSNWGPPLSYASTAGTQKVVDMLRRLGATDVQYAFDRACLRGNLTIARQLIEAGAQVTPGCVMGPCETLNPTGLQFLLDHGAEVADDSGDPLAPLALLLQTYSRHPEGKHACMQILAEHGVQWPSTPPMALHAGRQDLLEHYLKQDPRLFDRTFSHEEVFPPELGCHEDWSLALRGTPLDGATLLHMAVDYDEHDLFVWMLECGADPNARAAVDADGFGGHTPLFGCVVNQAYRCAIHGQDRYVRHLLDAGADPLVRASLRKQLRFVADETEHVYHDVTPREWGQTFHDQDWVNPAVLQLLP
jgi:ankyrin repeat protein